MTLSIAGFFACASPHFNSHPAGSHPIGKDAVSSTATGVPINGAHVFDLVAACDGRGRRELYVFSSQTGESRRMLDAQADILNPTWSPDGKKILYSIFRRDPAGKQNIDLYELNVKNGQTRLLANRHGANLQGDYAPDQKRIALVMSFLGKPQIFTLDPKTKEVSRLTQEGQNLEPAWSPKGTELAFSSKQTAGRPMIYIMDAHGKHLRRLTFTGSYNANPRWSPQGDRLVFAGWADSHFELFSVHSDGTHLSRLTQGDKNSEDPDYSPDAERLVFSSDRGGSRDLYVMNQDGTGARQVTHGQGTSLGNCASPRWAPTANADPHPARTHSL